MNTIGIVLCERLTPEEEIDFLAMVQEAVEEGELTEEEANTITDKEYALQAAITR